jgi:2-oxoglutarate dehydrogenase complex dehydrogenase (E1) component-like enzyme
VKSHQELQDFKKRRKIAEQILGLKLYKGASEVRELDRHVKNFRGAIKNDTGRYEKAHLQKLSTEFEGELHAELDKLMGQTKKDLNTYMKTLEEWAELKQQLHGKDERYDDLMKTELKYAKILNNSMLTRLESLNQSFHRLRKR